MPYILKSKKEYLEPMVKKIPVDSPADLSFLVTRLMMNYCEHMHPLDFAVLNDTIGAVRLAADEFSRRILVPYDGQRVRENGDVYRDFIRDMNLNTLF